MAAASKDVDKNECHGPQENHPSETLGDNIKDGISARDKKSPIESDDAKFDEAVG